jgi:hypothetical protein
MKISTTNKYSFGFFWVMLAAMIFGGVQYCQKKKALKAVQTIQSELKRCQTAPIQVVKQVTHDTVHDVKWLTPKVVTLTSVKTDTVEKEKWCKYDYVDVYTFGHGDSTGSFTLNLHIADCVPKYNISQLNFPVITKAITKTVTKDSISYKSRNQYGLLAGVSINSLRTTPMFQLGAYSVIGKWLVGTSLIFNPIDKLPYGSIMVGYSFRK